MSSFSSFSSLLHGVLFPLAFSATSVLSAQSPTWHLPEVLGSGPALWTAEPPAGYVMAGAPNCVAQVLLEDPFCESLTWDLLCDDAYACCQSQDGWYIVGCDVEAACNYNPDVCRPDLPSCVYCVWDCYSMEMRNADGQGWGGMSWSLQSPNGEVAGNGTLTDGFWGNQSACLGSGCYTLSVQGSQEGSSWRFNGSDLGPLQGTGDTLVEVSFGNGLGCTDALACNFQPSSCIDDGSCVYLENPVVDLFSHPWDLTVCEDCEVESTTTVLTFGDSLSADGVPFLIGSIGTPYNWSLCGEVLSLTELESFIDFEGDWDGTGFVGEWGAADGTTVGDFELMPSTLGCMTVGACNFDMEASVNNFDCTFPGCLDPLACNYDEGAGCEGECFYPPGLRSGCTNVNSSNFDEEATLDDGTCDLSYMCLEGTFYDDLVQRCLPSACPGDLNFDQDIDVNDLLAFLLVYDTVCP